MMLLIAFTTLLFLSTGCQLVSSEDVVAELGTSASLPCNYTAQPGEQVFAVSWKHDGEAVVTYGGTGGAFYQGDNNTRASFDESNFTLTLDNLMLTDDGSYECSITSSVSTPATSSSLRVLASPSLETKVFNFLDEGNNEPVTLAECTATGASKPYTMQWIVNTDDPVVQDSFKIESQNPSESSLFDAVLPLRIFPDPERNNGRTFTCEVTDALGKIKTAKAVLSVTATTTTPQTTTIQAEPKIVDFPTRDGGSITMVVGEKQELRCEITGVPSPVVSWFKKDQEVESGIGAVNLKLVPESLKDSETYSCKGHNSEGEDSRSFHLNVQGPPLIIDEYESNNVTEEITIDTDLESIELLCQVTANPSPRILWTVEGLNDTDFLVYEEVDGMGDVDSSVLNSVLNISSYKFNNKPTTVECTAINNHGQKSKKFNVVFKTVEASTGLVIGVVMAVIIVLVLIFLVVFFTLTRRQKKSADVSSPSEAEGGCMPCVPGCLATSPCGASPPKEELQEEVSGDQVKEVKEEGTSDEKQKLTSAEEKPAEDSGDEKKEETTESMDEKPEVATEKKNKRKISVSFPSNCCKGNKQELKEENDEEEGNDANGHTPQDKSEEKVPEQADKDSGKGDTLEKVVEGKTEEK